MSRFVMPSAGHNTLSRFVSASLRPPIVHLSLERRVRRRLSASSTPSMVFSAPAGPRGWAGARGGRGGAARGGGGGRAEGGGRQRGCAGGPWYPPRPGGAEVPPRI